MIYIPRPLRLKKEPLVQRWERLAAYAREVPRCSSPVLYTNDINTEWSLGAKRDRKDPDNVFFFRAEGQDTAALEDLKSGEDTHVILSEYKVSTKVPFIVRHVEPTHLKKQDDRLELASNQKVGVKGALKILKLALSTSALIPGEEELDEILTYLDNSTPVIGGKEDNP